ncbi:MAG: hypothetical protein ACYSUK_04275, partial [Planctomycetota bacterium]
TRGNAITDGHLARFEYTSLAEGDVKLNLINYQSYDPNHKAVYPKLEDIIIHQIDPDSQQMMAASTATQEAVETQTIPPPEPTLDMTPVELEKYLKDLWNTDEKVAEIYTKQEWKKFVRTFVDQYELFYNENNN